MNQSSVAPDSIIVVRRKTDGLKTFVENGDPGTAAPGFQNKLQRSIYPFDLESFSSKPGQIRSDPAAIIEDPNTWGKGLSKPAQEP